MYRVLTTVSFPAHLGMVKRSQCLGVLAEEADVRWETAVDWADRRHTPIARDAKSISWLLEPNAAARVTAALVPYGVAVTSLAVEDEEYAQEQRKKAHRTGEVERRARDPREKLKRG